MEVSSVKQFRVGKAFSLMFHAVCFRLWEQVNSWNKYALCELGQGSLSW